MFPALLACALSLGPAIHGEARQEMPRTALPEVRATLELPDGPIARALSGLSSDAPAVRMPDRLGRAGQVAAIADGAWAAAETWTRWAELLRAESQGSDPARRAELALLALQQERWDDAWDHLAAAAIAPEWLVALMPRFLPGVPAGTAASKGAGSSPLLDGVTLTPCLPPRTRARSAGRVDRRAMKIDGMQIGDAIVRMTISVEAEGVQIDIEHVSGGPAHFSVRIPEPDEFAIVNEYVDWYKQDAIAVPHAVEVHPGDETHTLYGRFEPRDPRWTSTMPTALPSQLRTGELWITVGASDAERALAGAIADSLNRGPLQIAARVVAPGAPANANGWSGITIDLADAPTRSRKLAWLTSSVERFALEPRNASPR